MKITKRFYIDIAIVLVLIGTGYIYREYIFSFARRQYLHVRPCATPIRYTIGDIDKRFDISKAEVKKDIEKAIAIWEKPINQKLFVYATSSDNADLSINFIYDQRQKTTEQLADIGSNISTDKATYDALNAEYKKMTAAYAAEKAQLEVMIEKYHTARDIYQKEVDYWNGRGGAPEKEHARLEKIRGDLTTQQDKIIQKQQELNTTVGKINQDGTTLNDWAKALNLNVKTYNTVGATAGREFEEGEYVSTINSQEINIYQYSNQTKLIRVLAHELGHALGLDHIENPKAIMYKLNEGINEKLTNDDISELKSLCGISENKII